MKVGILTHSLNYGTAVFGGLRAYWNDDEKIEKQIKDETKATSRCKPLNLQGGSGTDFMTGKPANDVWLFAKSY